MGDFYDKTKSVLGNSSLTPAPTQANATGTPEFVTCDSDIYRAYEEMPTREIMAAIIGAGLTPDATDLTQLFQAMEALVAKSAQNFVRATGTPAGVVFDGTPKSIGTVTLTLPALKKWVDIQVEVTSEQEPSGTIKFDTLKAGGVTQTVFNNMAAAHTYGSPGQTHFLLNHTLSYVPLLPLTTQVITVFYTGTLQDTPSQALFAKGIYVDA